MKKKMLVWETLSLVSGGQKMTLTVMDMLKNDYEFYCLIPGKGALSEELNAREIRYTLMGDQTMPTGIKGKKVIFRYAWLSVKAILKALRVIFKVKPDVIYAPGPAALPWSAVCGSLSHKPVVWHLHHIFLDGATKKLLDFCGGFNCVKKIIAVSNVVCDQIKNPKAFEKKLTLYNPVDFAKFSSGNGQKILDELNLNKTDKIIIGQVALLQPLKRQEIVIRTAVMLKQAGCDVKVLLAGRARNEDAQYVAQLHEVIAQVGMAGDVFVMGQRSDVPDILAAVDLVMIPSSLEGFPLAGLEAAAAGCPVLAADVGGAREFVEVSEGGECFELDHADNAARHVMTVIENKCAYSEAGKYFASLCTPENYANRIRSIFTSI